MSEKRKMTLPVRWKKAGGIPPILNFYRWRPSMPLMLVEFPNHPDEAHLAKRVVDAAIYRLLTHGRRG